MSAAAESYATDADEVIHSRRLGSPPEVRLQKRIEHCPCTVLTLNRDECDSFDTGPLSSSGLSRVVLFAKIECRMTDHYPE